MTIYDELLKIPDMDGIIYLKEKSRKLWKKLLCVLRLSGLYFVPKGKSKVIFIYNGIYMSDLQNYCTAVFLDASFQYRQSLSVNLYDFSDHVFSKSLLPHKNT